MASNITTNYLYSGKGPFDSKMWVKTYADLFAEGTFPSGSAYQGMIVAVGLNTADTTKNGIYYLFDSTVTNTFRSPSTAESNWHKVAELSELEKLSDSISTLAERIAALEAGEGEDTPAGITEEQLSDAINALRTEITEAGYLTADDLTDYAKKTDLPTVPTKTSELTNDSGYITADDIPAVDAYTKEETDALIADKVNSSTVDALAKTVADNKTETDAAIATKADAQVVSSLSAVVDTKANATDLAGKSDVGHKHDITDIEGYVAPDMDSKADAVHTHTYADITDAPNLDEYAKTEHTHTLSEITDYTAPDFTGYATEDFVTQKIAEAELADKEVDLSDYALKSELPVIPTKVSEFENDAGYLTSHQDISGKADKSAVDEIATRVDAIESALEDKAESSHTHTLSEITDYVAPEIPSLAGYATEVYVDAAVADKATTEQLTAVSDKVDTLDVNKADKSALGNYATTKSVEDLSYEMATALESKADANAFSTVSSDVDALKTNDTEQDTKLNELQLQIDALSGIEGSLSGFATDEEVESAVRTAIDSNEFIVYGTF